MIKKFFSNDYSLSLFNKIFVALTGIITSVFSTRYLGLLYRGEFTYINQMANVVVLILNLGLYQSFSYNYRKYGRNIISKYLFVFYIQFAFYLLSTIISIFAFSLTITDIFIIWLVPFSILKLQFENIMLIENIKAKLRLSMINSFIVMFCYIILYFTMDTSIMILIIMTIIIDIIVIGVYSYLLRADIKSMKLDFAFCISIIKFGWLPMLSSLLVTLNYNIDVLFLKNLSSVEQLSLYSVAASLMNYVWMIPDSFKEVLFSRVAKTKGNTAICLSVKISIILILFFLIIFMVFGKFLINLLYGAEFIDSYYVVLLLFLGNFSMIFFKMFGVVFLSEGRRYIYFFVLLASVIVNVIVNFLLIPDYGMYGAALASVGSYNICGIVFLIYFAKIKKLKVTDLLVLKKKDIRFIIQGFKH